MPIQRNNGCLIVTRGFLTMALHVQCHKYSWGPWPLSPSSTRQAMYGTYNVILTSVRVTIVSVEGNKYYIFWVCVFSLQYPACSVHAPYCYLWCVRLYNIFPHYLINCAIFEKKKLLETKCVFWFSLQLLSETFLILRRPERDVIRNVYRSSRKVPVIIVTF